MSPEAQRIAIAEACGMTDCEITRTRCGRLMYGQCEVPDYLNDLNAAFDAMRHFRDHVMNAEQWGDFGRSLYWEDKHHVLSNSAGDVDYYDLAGFVAQLEPQVICECLLRAIGKWEGGAP